MLTAELVRLAWEDPGRLVPTLWGPPRQGPPTPPAIACGSLNDRCIYSRVGNHVLFANA